MPDFITINHPDHSGAYEIFADGRVFDLTIRKVVGEFDGEAVIFLDGSRVKPRAPD